MAITASVLTVANYGAVIRAVNKLAERRAADAAAVGPIFLVACENALSAHDVLDVLRSAQC